MTAEDIGGGRFDKCLWRKQAGEDGREGLPRVAAGVCEPADTFLMAAPWEGTEGQA